MNSVGRGVTGALAGVSNKAVSFAGSPDNLVASNATYSNPTVYSEELWFKTTTTNGGKLIGFGNTNSGTSSGYDRHVYMETDGRLTFGVWTGQTNTITTTGSVQRRPVAPPGRHAVVGRHEAVRRRRAAGDQPADAGAGLHRLLAHRRRHDLGTAAVVRRLDRRGRDLLRRPSTATDVAQHFQLGTNTMPNSPPVAAFSMTVTDLTADVDATASTDTDGTISGYSWAFDDGTTLTGLTAHHDFTTPGDHTVTLTVTDDDGATASTSKTATFTAPNVASDGGLLRVEHEPDGPARTPPARRTRTARSRPTRGTSVTGRPSPGRTRRRRTRTPRPARTR